jgi:hypothetical protein
LSTSSRPRSTEPCAVKAKVTELGGSIPPKSERTPAKFNRFVKAEIARFSRPHRPKPELRVNQGLRVNQRQRHQGNQGLRDHRL